MPSGSATIGPEQEKLGGFTGVGVWNGRVFSSEAADLLSDLQCGAIDGNAPLLVPLARRDPDGAMSIGLSLNGVHFKVTEFSAPHAGISQEEESFGQEATGRFELSLESVVGVLRERLG
jgi:hypothetical protein